MEGTQNSMRYPDNYEADNRWNQPNMGYGMPESRQSQKYPRKDSPDFKVTTVHKREPR